MFCSKQDTNPIIERIEQMERTIATYTVEAAIYELEDWHKKENNSVIKSCEAIKCEAIEIRNQQGRTYSTELRQEIAILDVAKENLALLDDEERRIASMTTVGEQEQLKEIYSEFVSTQTHKLKRKFNYKAA